MDSNHLTSSSIIANKILMCDLLVYVVDLIACMTTDEDDDNRSKYGNDFFFVRFICRHLDCDENDKISTLHFVDAAALYKQILVF